MQVPQMLARLREWMGEVPSYVFHCGLWWLYTTPVLRRKAAATPYPRVARLLLRRSGVRIGRGARLHFGVLVLGRGRRPPPLAIGERAAVGPYVTFMTSSYPDHSRLNEHPDVRHLVQRFLPICVEADAWIGAGAVIFPGVTIGQGAIVGAGAVVRQDVAPWTVVAGMPAAVIRRLSPLAPEAAGRDAPRRAPPPVSGDG